MKKRVRKKREKLYEICDWYASDVIVDVSSPALGFDKPSYRGVLRQLPEFTPVLLDTNNPNFFDAATVKACHKHRLQYCAYRYGPPDSCLIVVSPVKYANIYEASYNNISNDVPLENYKTLQTGKHSATAKHYQDFLEELRISMRERATALMNMPVDSTEELAAAENEPEIIASSNGEINLNDGEDPEIP